MKKQNHIHIHTMRPGFPSLGHRIVAGVATAQQVVLEGQRAEPTAASRRERAAVV
jgi:hypothetical protein